MNLIDDSDDRTPDSTPTETDDGSPPTRPPDDTPSEKTPGLSRATPTTSPTPTATVPWFDRIIDAVDDIGCDPTGETPCDAALEKANLEGAEVRFPPGTYRFNRGHSFRDVDRLGFVGNGDVSFVPPDGFNDTLIGILGDRALFKGIDVDVSAEDTTAGLRFITDSGFLVEDIEFLGRGTHPDEAVVNALSLAVTDRSKGGIVRNVVARHGSAIGHYKNGDGRVGIWIGPDHKGRIRIEDCRLEEFGNNGIYASRCFGTSEVVGGVYRNNNVSSVRLGGHGNLIKGVTIEVDLDKYSGPYTRTESQYNTRGIILEQGAYDKSGRVAIDDCDVQIWKADHSQGGIVAWPTGNGPRIARSRITVHADWTPAVRGLSPVKRVDAGDRAVKIRDTTIAGQATNGSAIDFYDRPGATIERTIIEQTGANRDGIQLMASNPCTLTSTTITTTRYPIFVITPETSTSQCLVHVVGDTQLERSTPDPKLQRSNELNSAGSSTAGLSLSTLMQTNSGKRRCIGRSILSELATPKGIGITAIRDDTVYWVHRPSIEAAIDR